MTLAGKIKLAAPARILIVDIERVQGVAEIPFWDLNSWKGRRLPHDVVTSWPRTVCLAWKWLGDTKVQFAAEWEDGGSDGMFRTAWDLFNQADVVVGHNMRGFDAKKLAAEWAVLGLQSPSPYKIYDTLTVARQKFGFESNTLDSLCRRLNIGAKVDRYDPKVANAAVAGNTAAQKRLARYNRGDVTITEAAYLRLRAWSTNGVNLGVFVDNLLPLCPACGSSDLTDRTHADGPATTGVSKYPKYQCKQCGAWSRGKRATDVTTRRAL